MQVCRLKEKYSTWEWNYGFFPEYSILREKKFESGLISIRMEAVHAVISKIRIAGDFFGDGDITELENKLIGLPLDGQLESKLGQMGIDHYMHGITAGDLAGLLR